VVVVVGLFVVPVTTAPGADHPHVAQPSASVDSAPHAATDGSGGAAGIGASSPTVSRGDAPGGSPAAAKPVVASQAPARTIVSADAAGVPVAVRKEELPDDQPTLCTHGTVDLCVDRPGPTLPHPELPLL